MNDIHRSFAIITATATLSLALAACQSQSPPSAYVPTRGANVPAGRALSPGVPDGSGAIKSTCGDRIHIVLAGFVDCKFKEQHYGGTFRVYNRTRGLVSVTPSEGTKTTTFTVTGLLLGRGAFLIKDQHGHHFIMHVRVTPL